MKIVIAGTAHDLTEALNGSKLGDLYDLKTQTGVGMRSMKAALVRMGELGDDPAGILDDEVVLGGLIALVWLCRRRAGEKVTVAEARDVDLSEISFEIDDEPEEAPDPTSAPTDTGRGDENPADGQTET